MTTKVTVDAHAGWDIEVVKLVISSEGIADMQIETVAKNTVKDFYIHSHLQLGSIKELKQA